MSMISDKLKSEILTKIDQGESLENLEETYGIPFVLLEEWSKNPPELSTEQEIYKSFLELIDDEMDISSVSKLREVSEKKLHLITATMSEFMLKNNPSDPFLAKTLNMHADTILKLAKANVLMSEPSGVPSQSKLEDFKKTLTT